MNLERGQKIQNHMNELLRKYWNEIEAMVDVALEEDCAFNDVTTRALIPINKKGRAYVIAKGNGIVAGVDIFSLVMQKVDSEIQIRHLVQDGQGICRGEKITEVEGPLTGILSAERVALNFIQRLSGIATLTNRYVKAVEGTGVYITDTRKTVPGLRVLDKYAVQLGGGHNHRMNLNDGVLIKDNHIIAIKNCGVGLEEAVKKVRQYTGYVSKIEVEVESMEEAQEALSAGVDIIMLDNMTIEEMQMVVGIVSGKAVIEASGGVTIGNVRSIAETGVDYISIGAITHSVKALDFSLELEVC